MRILTTLALLLASFIPALGATTWPAGTNTANQTFYGNNNFLGTLKQNGSTVLTNLGGAPDAGTFNAATATAAAGAPWITGNQTITVSGDASGSGTTTLSLTVTNFHAITNRLWSVGTSAYTIDMRTPETDYNTNGVIVVSGYVGLTTSNQYQHCLIHFSQGSGSATAITFPANTHIVGTANLTNRTDVWMNYDLAIPETNAMCVPLW